MSPYALVATCIACVVAGCSTEPSRSPEEVDRIVAAADWERTTDVKIELKDAGFTPRELRLKVGQPYRLTLVNVGVNNHYFNAPEFFATIAARKAEVPRYAELKAPHFSKFELYAAGGTMDLWFIPLEKGRYRAFCHLGNHAEMGVEGQLVVE
ncbi:MAG TPA: cupredoxin domain-containing protein [Usitatibacteraceae bacterium]|nr:cupredoxin domain-containing protein [Usitatibacteraceae bacterium]